MRADIRINRRLLDDLMQDRGWRHGELARAMGMERTGVGRVLAGTNGISGRFIAGLRRAFPAFPVEDETRIGGRSGLFFFGDDPTDERVA